MTKRVPIKINVANALQRLGKLYRNPADAIKEHISNAIDEHLKAQKAGVARDSCHVVLMLEKKKVTIEYPYGMDRREFEDALQRVADSAKPMIGVNQIGQLGIGIFSFQQIGRKCAFFSKKAVDGETIRVTLREGMAEAEFDTALKREALDEPGIRIEVSDLRFDPTRSRGPLAPEKLSKVLAEKFGGYLKKAWLRVDKGWLTVDIHSRAKTYHVEPPKIDLPRLAKDLTTLHLPGEPKKKVVLVLYFDPFGKGTVAIRHMGVVVVEDLKQVSAYGLEESIYAGGFVKGFIDADFLQPLPARTGFEENREWISFLEFLDRHRAEVEAEVEVLKEKERERSLSEIQRRAIELARNIFDLEEFKDLELLGGSVRTGQPPRREGSKPTGERTGERSEEPGQRKETSGLRINYVEVLFEDGSSRHSRYLPGVVQANTLNPDYRQEMAGPGEAKLAYSTLIIGKETLTYNDKTGISDDYLEKLLSFYFKLKARIAPSVGIVGKRSRGRPRKLA
jgi:hypothetical protein